MRQFLLIIAIILAGLGIWIYSISRVHVPENHQAVVVQFGETHKIIEKPGTYELTPFVHKAILINTGPQCFNVHSADVLTSNRNRATVDTYLYWHVEDSRLFFERLQGDPNTAGYRIDDIVYSYIRDLGGSYSIDSLLTDEYLNEVQSRSNEHLDDFGVEVLSIHFQTSEEDPCASE